MPIILDKTHLMFLPSNFSIWAHAWTGEVISQFCWNCGEMSGFPAEFAAKRMCECPIGGYLYRVDFDKEEILGQLNFLIICGKDITTGEEGELYWHHCDGDGTLFQSCLPANIFPVPLNNENFTSTPVSIATVI